LQPGGTGTQPVPMFKAQNIEAPSVPAPRTLNRPRLPDRRGRRVPARMDPGNEELSQIVNITGEWIRRRVGIWERRIADTESVADMATGPARRPFYMSRSKPRIWTWSSLLSGATVVSLVGGSVRFSRYRFGGRSVCPPLRAAVQAATHRSRANRW
jgi:hypothetical protein